MKKTLLILLLIGALLISLSAMAASPDALQGYQGKTRAWQYAQFGAYPTDADGTVRPILWRVLSVDGQEAYLMSEYILFAHRVDPNCYPVNKAAAPYAGWETSELFGYLNTEFLQAAFTAEERSALATQADGGLVSLMDINDVKNKNYGFTAEKLRQAQSTAYAKANGLYVYQGAKQYSPYWSRTPSESKAYAHRRVMDDGKLGYICVEVQNLGVRPVIRLALSALSALNGEGTLDAPWEIVPAAAITPAVEPAADAADAPSGDEAAATEPAATETDTPSEDELSVAEPAASEADAPSTDGETAADDGDAPEQAVAADTATVRFESAHADRFPALTEEGFLPAGEAEFVLADPDNGLWLYASQDLRVEIVQKTDTPAKNRPWRWFEADIFTRPGSDEYLRVFYHEGNPKTKKTVEVAKIARENRLVFAMNSDWYYYRVQRNAKKKVMPVGIILRQGEILYDDPAKKLWTTIPNRDILAFYPDGNTEVYDYDGITAAELQARGAYDVLSFGPALLIDGQVTAQALDISARQKDNPRSGVGMVSPGHYVSIVMEGRRKNISVGCTVKEFAELFQAKGCTVAYNLDGGGTASMMFMGEYVNQMGNYTADARKQTEVLGVGVSDSAQ